MEGSVLADLVVGARFLGALPSFLRTRVTPPEARRALRHRLEHREARFLATVRRAVFEHRGSPYRELFRLAGCEYGDVERLVRLEGVEHALAVLLQQGVYLTVDEYKGRRPLVRAGVQVLMHPARLRNPGGRVHFPVRTSGSRGGGVTLGIDLAYIRAHAVDKCLVLDARQGLGWRHAIWQVPGGAAVGQVLRYSAMGGFPSRWFSQVDPASPELHPRYRWSVRALHWGGILAGRRPPRPEYVPFADPLPIARWLAGVLREGETPHLMTFPSAAVRLCQTAGAAGLDIGGAQFMLVGEPITAARLASIRKAGVEPSTCYGTIESNAIGYGCLAPTGPDDTHLLHDLHALVQVPDRHRSGLPAGALLISTIDSSAPMILLNLSVGDVATVTSRRCGCPLETAGWSTHLHTIRSFEKLTAGGMTFLGSDVIRVLEDVLPGRFGGGPADYQLVEAEGHDGSARLRLLVHPAVGPLDPEAVSRAFVATLGQGSGPERVMGLAWREAALVRVERRPPLATPSGKVLHLHVGRDRPAGNAGHLSPAISSADPTAADS
jgi:hypothetical protein